VWAKTVLFVMHDENDGFFDHVAPPTPPPNTAGEYLDRSTPGTGGFSGPIGLGFRVPLLVLSPFSRGGYVCSDVFDHTSQMRFLEARFGIKAPNISAWRRSVTGDLTSTIDPSSADRAVPALPAIPAGDQGPGCSAAQLAGAVTPGVPYAVPSPQTMPSQEPGTARRLG
jgi:phospholipase C